MDLIGFWLIGAMVFGVTGLIIYGFVFVLVEIFSPEGIRAKSKKRKEKQRR